MFYIVTYSVYNNDMVVIILVTSSSNKLGTSSEAILQLTVRSRKPHRKSF